MIVYGILRTITDGAVRLFSASGRIGENFSLRDFLQHYGFASRPKVGAELVIVVEGNLITAIGSDDRRYRLALVEGEAALYDDLGQKVHLTRSGIIVQSPLHVTTKAPEIVEDGHLVATGHAQIASGRSGTFFASGQNWTVRNGVIVED
jgi:phage gp45-like